MFFRLEGGAKSEAILTIIFIQKEFLFEDIFCYTEYAHNIISKSAEMVMLEQF